MAERNEVWKLLRTKTDETVDDTDFAGTNASIADIDGNVGFYRTNGVPITKIYLCILATDGNRVVQNRGAATVDIQLVMSFSRANPNTSGAAGLGAGIIDSVVTTVPLNRRIDVDLAGAEAFTVRITNDAALPGGATQLEVWWREASA